MVYQDPRYRDPEYIAKWRAANPERVKEYNSRKLDTPEKREANRLRASRAYYANREERKARARVYYAAHREEQILGARARKLGVDREHLRRLLDAQGTTCAICTRSARLSVDHDHATGRVRGLVCAHCNFVLGHAKDDPAVLRAAAAYLEAV